MAIRAQAMFVTLFRDWCICGGRYTATQCTSKQWCFREKFSTWPLSASWCLAPAKHRGEMRQSMLSEKLRKLPLLRCAIQGWRRYLRIQGN